MLSFFLGGNLGVELLGYMETLCLTFLGTVKLFTKPSVRAPLTPCPCQHTQCGRFFKMLAIFIDVKWNVIVVFI